MNKGLRAVTVVLSIGILLLIIAWLSGAFNEKISPAQLPLAKSSTSAYLVDVEARLDQKFEKIAGTIRAKQATSVAARILAPIEKIHVAAGDQVQQGDLLVELDKRVLAAQQQQAKQQLIALQAQLREADSELARIKSLRERQLVSQADLDKTTARQQNLAAQLTGAEQRLMEAEAALSYARILAPLSGTVIDRFVEPGDTVSPGQQILSLYNPGAMRIEAHVRESLAIRLQPGQVLQAHIDALAKDVQVVVEELVPAADPGARTMLVKAGLPVTANIYPGMYAELFIPAGEIHRRYIPLAAVQSVGQLDFVLVQGASGMERRFVRLGEVSDKVRAGVRLEVQQDEKTTSDSQVVVISGLEPGEQVLVRP
jgi:RND family efflux transporter MFP subunit